MCASVDLSFLHGRSKPWPCAVLQPTKPFYASLVLRTYRISSGARRSPHRPTLAPSGSSKIVAQIRTTTTRRRRTRFYFALRGAHALVVRSLARADGILR